MAGTSRPARRRPSSSADPASDPGSVELGLGGDDGRLHPLLLFVLEVGVERLPAAARLLRLRIGDAEAATTMGVLVVDNTAGDHRQAVVLDDDAYVGRRLEDGVVIVERIQLEVQLEPLAATQPHVDAEGCVGAALLLA